MYPATTEMLMLRRTSKPGVRKGSAEENSTSQHELRDVGSGVCSRSLRATRRLGRVLSLCEVLVPATIPCLMSVVIIRLQKSQGARKVAFIDRWELFQNTARSSAKTALITF